MSLTNGEKSVRDQLLRGKSNPEIAIAIGVNEDTVKKRLYSLYEKFGITDGDKRVKLAVECYYRLHPEKRI